jgi:rhodanese-related sulfurtransferase
MIKKINREELMGMISSGEKFKLIDVLSRESFENEHIKGAISMPLEEIGRMAGKLFHKKDKIVVYCASFECQASTQAAEKLISFGFKNVMDYKGGLKDYKEAHLPLAGKMHEEPAACPSCSVR